MTWLGVTTFCWTKLCTPTESSGVFSHSCAFWNTESSRSTLIVLSVGTRMVTQVDAPGSRREPALSTYLCGGG